MTDRTRPPIRPPRSTDRVRAVQRRLATAVLPPLPAPALGDVRLLPHQRRAAARLLGLLQAHRGALLADDVGLGKTYTALAVAHRYGDVRILAPAGLVPMWRAALLRTGLARVSVHSLHRLSRQADLAPHATGQAMQAEPATAPHEAPPDARHGPPYGPPLVIIDEAHLLRNAGTARYRHVAGLVTGCHVLLLSATPLHNTPDDLGALFALFRGTHDVTLSRTLLARLIVRRDGTQTGTGASRTAPPAVRTHAPFTVRQDPETLEQLLALPDPLPARDGATAGALIRLGLLRAWCSSDAALTHALGRRLQHGVALHATLEAGRNPTSAELRGWLVGHDTTTDVQLGFAELLSPHPIPDAERQSALQRLGRHCEALRALRAHHVAHARADAVRAAFLRTIRRRHHDVPVVAFSQHARTVQALFRALSDIAGVGMLTGAGARIASGPVPRPELLGWFAPRAQGRPPPPERLRVTLLLTTDLIAEGVNLQDAGVVIHLDLPWTHAVRVQRTGRVVRIGSPHPVVHEYRLRAMAAARRVLRAESRVARKARLGNRLVGGRPSTGAPRPSSAAWHQAEWENQLWEWALHPHDPGDLPVEHAPPDDLAPGPASEIGEPVPWCAVAHTGGAGAGAIVLLHTDHGPRLLACSAEGGTWRVSTRAERLLAVSRGDAARDPAPVRLPTLWEVRRLARAWARRAQARESAGAPGAAVDAAGAWGEPEVAVPRNRAQRAAMRWLQQMIGQLSPVERTRHRAAVRHATLAVTAARGAGAEPALVRWMHTRFPVASDALEGWRAHPELVAACAMSDDRHGAPRDLPRRASPGAVRVAACLFVGPSRSHGR